MESSRLRADWTPFDISATAPESVIASWVVCTHSIVVAVKISIFIKYVSDV